MASMIITNFPLDKISYSVPVQMLYNNYFRYIQSGMKEKRIIPIQYIALYCWLNDHCHNQWGKVGRFTVWRRCRPCSPRAHWDHLPRHRPTSSHWERQKNSNCVGPTDGPTTTPRLTVNPDSDVLLEAGSIESNGDSDYVESPTNLPMISANMPELEGHILELQWMHEFTEVDIDNITQSTELFIQSDKLDPMELVDGEITPAKNHRDNGAFLPHSTQPFFPCSPLTDALVAPYKPPLRPHVDAGNAARL